ncbi:Pc22g26580 [Penicillium rubens Wisconsin 54-1255]|uniref:Pc22g26580 protein n=1 Tax=Penicillium rubens (strain ATCC 28089 / DSM 1075 / NRRL 1951 / Wisconsin 54-1255) TaxID=500485 RepID=B6HTW1_PENRW|nr:Pc22g26580 [Penicillium rubens Wisconsin 54-1255]
MKLSTKSRLDSLVSTTALSFTVAVLVCLSLVFVGCSSSSSPKGLHFLKVDLKEFPKLRDLQIRGSFNVDTARIESGGRNAVEGVASSIHASANEATHEATSAASSMVEAQVHEFKSHLPQYYLVGLWSYCKAKDGSEMVCSDPSSSFTFDLSAVLDINLSNILPDIDLSLVSGYRRFSQSVICLYIAGFVVTTLSGVLACRKVFFSKGSRPLAIFCTLSSMLITTATIVVTVMYGVFASKVKDTLQPYGVEVTLGAKMFTTAWLAVFFSIGGSTIWLVHLFCCCI